MLLVFLILLYLIGVAIVEWTAIHLQLGWITTVECTALFLRWHWHLLFDIRWCVWSIGPCNIATIMRHICLLLLLLRFQLIGAVLENVMTLRRGELLLSY